MSVILRGGDSGTLANVDANKNLQVNLPVTPSQAGYVRMLAGDGSSIVLTENGAQYVSSDSLTFFEQVDGNAVNTNIWTQSSSGMTIAQSNGFIQLNSAAAKTANSYSILTSIKAIPLYGVLPVKVSMNCFVPVVPQSLFTIEMGIGSVAANGVPTDGCFFRWTPAGSFQAVINNSGVETNQVITPNPAVNEVELFEFVLVEDVVIFSIGDVLVATIQVPLGQAFPTGSGRLPMFFRVYNAGSSPATAPQLSIGQVTVVQQDMLQNKPWSNLLISMGRGAYQSPITPFAQTANHANSTNPTSATLSNTAAGYATLGGRYQFAAVAGAATDFCLFAYQVPVGYQLIIRAIRISAVNVGAAVGLTGTVLDWALGVNSSAVSLATADGASTWAPRRIPLGTQGFPALAAIGATANDIFSEAADTVVDGGRYLHVILQVPVGLATGSQIIRGDVSFPGSYWE